MVLNHPPKKMSTIHSKKRKGRFQRLVAGSTKAPMELCPSRGPKRSASVELKGSWGGLKWLKSG